MAGPQLRETLARSSAANGPELLGRAGPAGFLTAGTSDATGFEGLMATALLQANEEAAGPPAEGGSRNQATARDLARLRAVGLQRKMLAGLTEIDGDPDRASGLVERANLEALFSSGHFGNLLGLPAVKTSGQVPGRALSREELNSWRQRNSGPLRLGRQAGEDTAKPAANLLGMPYGLIRAPRRSAPASAPAVAPAPTAPAPASEKAEPAVSERAAGELTQEKLDRMVAKVALALNLDPNLIKAVIKTESNFDPRAVSKAGAKGLMQLMPATARELGVKDVFNPLENVWAGASYLKKMLDRHGGDIKSALASYNWGPGNFDRHGSQRMPGETRRYISAVTRHYAQFKQDGVFQA